MDMDAKDWKNMYWDQVRKRKEGFGIVDYSTYENDNKYLLDENILLKNHIKRLKVLVDVDKDCSSELDNARSELNKTKLELKRIRCNFDKVSSEFESSMIKFDNVTSELNRVRFDFNNFKKKNSLENVAKTDLWLGQKVFNGTIQRRQRHRGLIKCFMFTSWVPFYDGSPRWCVGDNVRFTLRKDLRCGEFVASIIYNSPLSYS